MSVRKIGQKEGRLILRDFASLESSDELPENVHPDKTVSFQSGSSPVLFAVERLHRNGEVKVLYGDSVLVGTVSPETEKILWERE